MVLFFITTLITSLAILSLMLWFKRYELTTGHVLLGQRRHRISRFSARMVFLFGTAVPHFIRYEAHRLYRLAWVFVHALLARILLAIGQWLEGIERNVQEKAGGRQAGQASPFLREVGEYKKKIAETGESNRIEQE